MKDRSRYLTEEAAADRIGVSRKTLQRYRITGDGPPYVRIGPRRVAYPEEGIAAWAGARTFAHRAAEAAAKAPR
jgi:predicted DNA-binding transcriptional regulator AlpA